MLVEDEPPRPKPRWIPLRRISGMGYLHVLLKHPNADTWLYQEPDVFLDDTDEQVLRAYAQRRSR